MLIASVYHRVCGVETERLKFAYGSSSREAGATTIGGTVVKKLHTEATTYLYNSMRFLLDVSLLDQRLARHISLAASYL